MSGPLSHKSASTLPAVLLNAVACLPALALGSPLFSGSDLPAVRWIGLGAFLLIAGIGNSLLFKDVWSQILGAALQRLRKHARPIAS
jgi:hypothetical protein